jgi:hypothetical protein
MKIRYLDLEYFEIVDSENLQPAGDGERVKQGLTGCIAVRVLECPLDR